ncbi:MAG TPA: YdcF family protein [Verrucomicrobiae bacterium]|nr:YdcF family protein [Verrucomicrobiae bacterium]
MNRKRLLIIAALAAGLLTLIVVAGVVFPQQLLCVDNGNVQADALVVLGGGSYERPLRAAQLFADHAAPRILVSGRGDCETNRQLLESRGVPAQAIQIECNSKNTFQNALFSIRLLRADGARRVILVTSWYHSRRALRCFQHDAADIQFFSRPAYFGYDRSEWRRQGMWHYIGLEYVKLAGYWLRYGVRP